MSVRKAILFIAIFIAGAIFGRPLALGCLGICTQTYLFFHDRVLFSYDSIQWRDGGALFLGVHLQQKGSFDANIQEVHVVFSEKFLKVDRPQIVLCQSPKYNSERSDWTFAVHEGTLLLNGFGFEQNPKEISFSCEKSLPAQIGRFVLQREESKCDLEILREGEEIWIDATLCHFDAAFLDPWLDLKGTLDGKLHLIFVGDRCKRGSVRLNISEGGYRDLCTGLAGEIDWEGKIEGFSWQDTRIRVGLSDGTFQGKKGRIEHLRGEWSLVPSLGVKGEVDATGVVGNETFPVSWNVRAFLATDREHWIESSGSIGRAEALLEGKEEAAGYRFRGEVLDLGPAEGTLLQTLLALLDPKFDSIDWEKGILQLSMNAVLENRSLKEWTLSLLGDGLACRYAAVPIACEKAGGHLASSCSGDFFLQGLSFDCQLPGGSTFQISDWNGEAAIEEGVFTESLFVGKISDRDLEVSMAGKLDAFTIHTWITGRDDQVRFVGSWNEALLVCEILEGTIDGFHFSGTGWMDKTGHFGLYVDQFQGSLALFSQWLRTEELFNGKITSTGDGFLATGDFAAWDWSLQAKGEIREGIAFYCPVFEKRGDELSFDIRLENGRGWDWLRLYGVWNGLECYFDPARTHFMGSSLDLSHCTLDHRGIKTLSLQTEVCARPFFAMAPICIPEMQPWSSIPIDGEASIAFSFDREFGSSLSIEGKTLSWKGNPLPFLFTGAEHEGKWRLANCQVDSLQFDAHALFDGNGLKISEGSIRLYEGATAEFFGKIDSSFHWDLQFPLFQVDLKTASFIAPSWITDGMLEGKACVCWNGALESDIDCYISQLTTGSISWVNEGPVHLSYSSERGVLCRGLDLHTLDHDLHLKAGLLKYDAQQELWSLTHSRIYFSLDCLDLLPKHWPMLQDIRARGYIDLLADVSCPADGSKLACFVKEGNLSWNGAVHNLQELSLRYQENLPYYVADNLALDAPIEETTVFPDLIEQEKFKAGKQIEREIVCSFQYLYQGEIIQLSASVSLGEILSGKIHWEEMQIPLEEGERPLSLCWTYSKDKGFAVQELEGKFAGIDASFHALEEENSLIGSARVHFGRLSPFLPQMLREVFTDLKMGKGYEFKGKLSFDPEYPFFQGLLSGKQIDLFGYQLRTLLGQIELNSDHVYIQDLKISDSAGMMKIDSIEAASYNGAPWTISIPRLSLFELRPSLLQKTGAPSSSEPAGPLVVRELILEQFQGLLDDSKTYTAKGELRFINSYRREHTVFDIPSDLLGRIMGLDLELLIPVCGTLRYELKEGLFHLLELKGAYSEANRSEFFLVMDPMPTMDLDGNLHILVNMKQFVLFKFTESFLISIDGQLDDPQFHLQRKQRFLGL